MSNQVVARFLSLPTIYKLKSGFYMNIPNDRNCCFELSLHLRSSNAKTWLHHWSISDDFEVGTLIPDVRDNDCDINSLSTIQSDHSITNFI
jgi:hypothetical protein